MIDIEIPDFGTVKLEHLVLDFNGTLAVDGALIPGVEKRLQALATTLDVHVVTADTFGNVGTALAGMPCQLQILAKNQRAAEKRDLVKRLGSAETVAIGNGRNDRLMLEEARIGIAIIQGEGAASQAIAAADVVCTEICGALDLLRHPLRLVSALRG